MEHSLEKLHRCPSCASTELSPTLSCPDFTYSKNTFNISSCASCGLYFTNPRPDEKNIGKYYDNPDYVSHSDTSEGPLFKVYAIVKSRALKQKRALLESLTQDRTILEYGAGTGDFSTILAQNNWAVFAYEPDEKARQKIAKKSPQTKLVSNLDELANNSVSMVSLWHVLEHVHRLDETLTHFSRLLKSNGQLVIAVPNHTSFDASFYAENWAAYDVPRHLYHFNPETLKPLIEKFGFELLTVKPMWFDSFYVSLLSEQILGNDTFLRKPFGWVRAFIIGLISNLLTLFDTKKCSSVIYIFQKRD
ncbi:MAG: class I SAM-dependent methyltransferase [Flavobacteriales bacterium]|nr:class I SAM-dependent methyltransferase [Flavobacteriales bacterium]